MRIQIISDSVTHTRVNVHVEVIPEIIEVSVWILKIVSAI